MTAPPLLDGLGKLRAEIGETPSIEFGAHDFPDDQHSLPAHQHTLSTAFAHAAAAGSPMGGAAAPDNMSPREPDEMSVGVHGQLNGGPLDKSYHDAALAGLYGSQFPLISDNASADDWVRWAEELWMSYGPGMFATLHLVERNRLYFDGIQWVSAVGFGPWREPAKPRDVVRTVRNFIKPALNMRTQLIAEQRPGFSCTPASGDPKAAQRAEANQVALEWSWHEQDMPGVAAEAAHRVGTDGVSFLEVYWDPDAGPWYEVPKFVSPEAAQFPIGKKPGEQFPMGDVRTKVRKIEQVRVSPDATANRMPMIWIIREVIGKQQAIAEHGMGVAKESGHGESDDDMQHVTASRHGYIMPREDELLREQESIVRFTVYCDKSEFLPEGLTMVSVGQKLVVEPMPLEYGRVPMVRWSDGSTDPSFYPIACMQDWVDSQQRINAIVSKWMEAIRKGANANFLARGGVLAGETLIGGTLNVYEVKGPQVPLADVVQPIGPFDLSPGAQLALAQEVKTIEDLTGYNDATRGSFTPDQSGRAILAIREQVERVFAPFVNAASRAMVDWAEVTLAVMKQNYDLPRKIAVEGADRPDLGRMLTSEDIDTAAQVWVEPETLMPMPRSLRLAVLDDLLQKQLITPQTYMRRMPFGMVRSLESPDSDQTARAHRIAESIIRVGSDAQYPILWMDDEAIHQDVLERQIIFDDSLAPQVRSVAYERWMRLAQQAQEKQQGMAMPPGEPQPQAPQGAPSGALPGQATASGLEGPARQLGAAQAPVGPSSPVAAQPLVQGGGLPDQLQAASRFEMTQPR